MSPLSWHKKQCRRNACAALIELWFHVILLSGIVLLINHTEWIKQDRTWILLCTFLVLSVLYRLLSAWNPSNLWIQLSKQPKGDSTYLLRDLALKRGTFPKEEALPNSVIETAERWPKARFPYFLIWKKGGIHLLLTLLCSLPIILSDHLPKEWLHRTQHIHISVTPPDYLNLPARQLHPQEEQLNVYPGSLIRWSSNDSKSTLSDHQQRQYFSRSQDGRRQFESRVMEKNTFFYKNHSQEHPLNVELLEDAPPTIIWQTSPRPNPTLNPTSISFYSKDDHGLEETLITVNGREIEYAGKPKGLPTHQYRWTFNPNDHINLLGGNITLQISAYDNDKINGPKVTVSDPWIWEFPGVEELSKQASQRIAELKKLSIERQNDQPSAKSPDILSKLRGLEQELRNNPALPPDVANMVSSMSRDYQRHARQNTPKASQTEKQELDRNDDILDSIQSMLDQVLSTIRAAEIVKTMSELQQDLKNGKHDPQKMEQAYKKLAEHLNQSAMPEGLKKHLLSKFNEAELSASMGDTKGASEAMEELMDILRQEPSMPQAPNPMAKKFQKLMSDLGELIQSQQANMENWSKAKSKPLKGKEGQAIKDIQDLIEKDSNSKAYDQMIQSLRRPHLDKAEQQKLLQELSRPHSPTQRGRMLRQLSQQLNRRAQGHTNPQPLSKIPWAPELQKKLDELPVSSVSKAPAQKLQQDQGQLAKKGQGFSDQFKLEFGPLMPNPALFQLAQQAALLAKRATQSIAQSHPSSEMTMNQAALNWIQLRQQLQQMQQQSQGGQGSSRPQLSIGKDGKLQLSPQGQPQQDDGDGDWKHKQEDLDIALPEEFQNSQKIEQMLRDELKRTSDKQQRETFQNYILELLE